MWNRSSRFWYAVYYTLGSITVVATITVASQPEFITKAMHGNSFLTLAWIAAILQGLNTFFSALPKATAYRAAWRILWLARLDHIQQGDKGETGKLLQAIATGWGMIDGGYIDPTNRA
jgi:hypothetical protein